MTQTDIQGFTPSQIYAAVKYMEQGGQHAPPSTPVGTASLTNDPPIDLAPASQATTSPGQAATMPMTASFNIPPSITCSSCGAINHIPNSDVHYVVTVGKSVGVFSDLAYVQNQVCGVSGACYKRHSSQAAALQAYQQAAMQGVVRIVN